MPIIFEKGWLWRDAVLYVCCAALYEGEGGGREDVVLADCGDHQILHSDDLFG